MDDNGYDISDYQDVDPLFGTLDDLDALIGALHERGIKLVMDLVVNHTSDEHPWFVESRRPRVAEAGLVLVAARRAPAPSRCARAPSRPTGSRRSPARPGSTTSAAASTTCTCSARKQPDLNWENPEVRQAVYAMMRWWVDRGIDGFRMDVINLISKAPGAPATADVPPGKRYASRLPYRRQRSAARRVPAGDERARSA